MQVQEFTFRSADGETSLHAVEWSPEGQPWAVVQIAHGLSEYVQCYAPLAEWLADRGVAVAGHDHLGHGLSRAAGYPLGSFGPPGRWDIVAEDLSLGRSLLRERFPGVPCFLLGHSMGSLLARTDLLRRPGAVEGAVLAATGWLPPPLTLLARAAAALLGGFRGRDRVHPLVARATAGVFAETPLCAGPPTTGLLREILRGLALVQRRRYLTRMDPAVPVLFLSGARDPLGWYGRGVRKTANRFRRAGVRDVTCRVYDGLRHKLLLDPGREAVWADLLSWMTSRVPEAENITSELKVRK